jgi:D-sedoheptulose 7-phosphate isomerase
MQSIKEYLEAEAGLYARVDMGRVNQVIAQLERARQEGRRVFLFGNGGSASTASHFACDLGKGTVAPERPRLKVMALTDSIPVLTAYANDNGYDTVFAEPLLSLAEQGDIAIGFSGSGNSPNVLHGMEAAEKRGLATIGFTGFQGGKLKDRVELEINVPSELMGQIEDVHLALTHAICEMLKIHHG